MQVFHSSLCKSHSELWVCRASWVLSFGLVSCMTAKVKQVNEVIVNLVQVVVDLQAKDETALSELQA
jgi:hypothetical protein